MAVKQKGIYMPKINEGPRFCVYLGPSIRGVILTGAIIQGTHDAAVKEYAELIERFPPVRNLIVKDVDLSESRIKIKTSGNALYEYNRKLTAMLAGK